MTQKYKYEDVKELAFNNNISYAMLMAFLEVETGGQGFDTRTGKIIIQFEPTWFRKKAPYAPSGTWSVNKVDVQNKEWIAFNDAFSKDKKAAMEATSWGLPQIMGYHWQRLGYISVDDMVDNFKKGEYFQLLALVRFIKTDPELNAAMKQLNYSKIAAIYNGKFYKEIAAKYGREPYDESLRKAYIRWAKK